MNETTNVQQSADLPLEKRVRSLCNDTYADTTETEFFKWRGGGSQAHGHQAKKFARERRGLKPRKLPAT